MRIAVRELLWMIHWWALIVGTGAIPCVLMFLLFRKFNLNEPSFFYRHLRTDYLLRAVESMLLLGIFLFFPLESNPPGRIVPFPNTAISWVVMLWMLDRLVKTGVVWWFALNLSGFLKKH